MGSADTVECAGEGCSEVFKQNSYNHRFHNTECLRQYTNKRVLADYHAKKAIDPDRHRVCATDGCGTVLSRYNEEDVCALHTRKAVLRASELETKVAI